MNRVWWAVLALMLATGAVFYSIGYDRGLPLYESVDERNNLHEVYALRGLTDDDLWKPGYPPGILYVNHAAQVVTEWLTGQSALDAACSVILNLRRVAIPVNLASALVMALLARRLGGDAAGLLASGTWLFNAGVLAQTQYAFPQTYELFAYLLAFWFALLALERDAPLWALLSVGFGLVAVIFKYPAFPVLGLGVGAALWQMRGNARRWLPVLGVQAVLIALCAAWLFFGYDALRLVEAGHEEAANVVLRGGLLNVFAPEMLLTRFGRLAAQAGVPLAVLVALVIGGGVLYWRRGKTAQRLALVALVGLTAAHVLFLVAALAPNYDGLRQNLTVTGYVHVLAAVLLATVGAWLGERAGREWVRGAVVSGVAAVWLLPLVSGAWAYVQERRLPVSYAAFSTWAGESLPINFTAGESRLLVTDDRPFAWVWTCHSFPFYPAVEQGELDTRLLDAWRGDGVMFAQVDSELAARVERAGYLDEMTLLAEFPLRDEASGWRTWRRGNDDYLLRVYHLLPIENRLDTVFGEQIGLVGYTAHTADDMLDLWLYWQPLTPPAADYRVFVHVTPPDALGEILAQADGVPTSNPNRPTSTWGRANEALLVGHFVVALPDDDAVLRVGLYDPVTGRRLLTGEGADMVIISP